MGENDDEQPVLPYAGGSGWSGTEASREREEERDDSGKTARSQRKVLRHVQAQGTRGTTIAELREAFPDDHHGVLSGALTNLHKGNRIVRTNQKRGRCSVYIGSMALLAGRTAIPPTSTSPRAQLDELLSDLSELAMVSDPMTSNALIALIARYSQ